jgi:hypothetical protein
MKRLTYSVLALVAILMMLSSCSYEVCPTYANRNHIQGLYGKKVNTEVKKGHKTRVW